MVLVYACVAIAVRIAMLDILWSIECRLYVQSLVFPTRQMTHAHSLDIEAHQDRVWV